MRNDVANLESPHPEGGYVFIVTYGRSGSTLLQNLLNSIPGYQIRGENNNALFHLMRAWYALKTSRPLQGMRSRGEKSDQTHPWFGGENIEPQMIGSALAAEFTRSVLQPDPQTLVSGFKEIRFHQVNELFSDYLDFIYAFFPNSRFVFNTRDHLSVMKSSWWAEVPPSKVQRELCKAEERYQAYLAKHPERGMLVHYDDYVDDPSKLHALYAFLGETADPTIINKIFDQKLTH